MRTIFLLLSTLISSISIAQTIDTLELYNAYCESNNPHEIDTTIFTYQNDILYIRNIHSGMCAAERYRALMHADNDTLKIDIVNIYGGGECTGDCSMGYTIKIQIASFDTLNLIIRDEYFTVVKSEIIVSSRQHVLGNFKIFPNPVENYLKIVGDKIEKVEILDLTCNVLISKNSSFENINLSSLKPGIYIVSIYTDDYYLTRKIIKK